MNAVKRPGSLASSTAFDRLAPGAAVGLRAGRRKTLRQLAFAEAGNDIDGGLRPLTGVDLIIPFAALRRCHQHGIGAHQLRKKSHAVRMVRHDQKIQWPRQLGMLRARRDHLLAFGETVSVLRTEPRTERTGIHWKRCVQMSVAKEWVGGKVAARVRRVRRLGRKTLLRFPEEG